jgi:hypothetical protein
MDMRERIARRAAQELRALNADTGYYSISASACRP